MHQGMTLSEIALRYNCAGETIRCALKAHGIARRPRRLAYPKQDYADTLQNKAYLIGLRLGDLHDYKPSASPKLLWYGLIQHLLNNLTYSRSYLRRTAIFGKVTPILRRQ